jgi:hypothetical protein
VIKLARKALKGIGNLDTQENRAYTKVFLHLEFKLSMRDLEQGRTAEESPQTQPSRSGSLVAADTIAAFEKVGVEVVVWGGNPGRRSHTLKDLPIARRPG